MDIIAFFCPYVSLSLSFLGLLQIHLLQRLILNSRGEVGTIALAASGILLLSSHGGCLLTGAARTLAAPVLTTDCHRVCTNAEN